MQQYDLIEETFVSPMVLSKSWTDLGITVGTTNLTQAILSANTNQLYPMFTNRAVSGSNTLFVFEPNDRARFKSVRIRCNYADGLILNSTASVIQNVSPYDPWDPNNLTNILTTNYMSQIFTTRLINNDGVTTRFGGSMYGPSQYSFEDWYALDRFESRLNISGVPIPIPSIYPPVNPDYGFYIQVTPAWLSSSLDAVRFNFSTKSIDPKHQDGILNIWIEAIIQHSFPMKTMTGLV